MASSRQLQRRHSAPELAAALLRDRLLSGELAEGDELPKIDEIAQQLGMSKPAVREAYLILEAEGLLRIRRGNVGGAVVQNPTPQHMAYSLGLVLQAGHTELADVRQAISLFEPIAVGLCAARKDRRRTVLPALHAHHTAYERALATQDASAAVTAAREWHETIAATCGNQTVSATLGMLERLWTTHLRDNATRRVATGLQLSDTHSRAVLDDHAHIQQLILEGDADEATAAAREHLARARVLPTNRDEDHIPVRAELIYTPQDRASPGELY